VAPVKGSLSLIKLRERQLLLTRQMLELSLTLFYPIIVATQPLFVPSLSKFEQFQRLYDASKGNSIFSLVEFPGVKYRHILVPAEFHLGDSTNAVLRDPG